MKFNDFDIGITVIHMNDSESSSVSFSVVSIFAAYLLGTFLICFDPHVVAVSTNLHSQSYSLSSYLCNSSQFQLCLAILTLCLNVFRFMLLINIEICYYLKYNAVCDVGGIKLWEIVELVHILPVRLLH